MNFMKMLIGKSADTLEIFGYINQEHAEQYIYLMAGVHGDEPEGVYVLDKLFKWLQTQEINLPIILVPEINPDGLAIKTRVNLNGVDLNRNWPTSDWSKFYTEKRYFPGVVALSETENLSLFNLFHEYKPALIISFHAWQPMLDCNQNALKVAEYISQYNNYKIVLDIGYPTPGSLGSYADEVLKCGILTYELPQQSTKNCLENIWLQNAKGLKSYFLNCKLPY